MNSHVGNISKSLSTFIDWLHVCAAKKKKHDKRERSEQAQEQTQEGPQKLIMKISVMEINSF